MGPKQEHQKKNRLIFFFISDPEKFLDVTAQIKTRELLTVRAFW